MEKWKLVCGKRREDVTHSSCVVIALERVASGNSSKLADSYPTRTLFAQSIPFVSVKFK
jgi:hypothetical protein